MAHTDYKPLAVHLADYLATHLAFCHTRAIDLALAIERALADADFRPASDADADADADAEPVDKA